jgi:CDP-diacylglycerol--serine O-phosphatidyltransferase
MIEKIKRLIPNTLTCLNLFSGCMACLFALQGWFEFTFIFILCSVAFDFCDGLFARMLKVSSPIGKELDSLADDISFGLVPAMVVFTLMRQDFAVVYPEWLKTVNWIPYLAFLIAIFSALRLAKFNIDPRQTHSFIGLPTPANTLFWISFAIGMPYLTSMNVLLVIVLILLSSWLLVSEVPMFSLKFANLSWKDNKLRFIFLITCLPLFLLGWLSLAAIILWYVLLSLLNDTFTSKS